MQLPRMFPYFGSKHRIAGRYPGPKYSNIIEPFAGSAGYSLKYSDRQVKLYDLNPTVIAVWNFLIKANPYEILRIPGRVVDVRVVEPEEARWLVGFWMGTNLSHPNKSSSMFQLRGNRDSKGNHNDTSFWGDRTKQRLAVAVTKIKHWTAQVSDYREIPNCESTWFIDPPYQGSAGSHYNHNNRQLDFQELSEYCQTRLGQVIVCDQVRANWLPFTSIGLIKGATHDSSGKKKQTEEAMWTNG